MPKHRKLLKLFADRAVALQTLVNRVEADFMREKRLHEVDELLYFAMDEKGHNVHLSDRGSTSCRRNDPDAFVAPDLSAGDGRDRGVRDALSIDEKRERIQELEGEYAAKSEKIHVIHQLLKAYTLFQKDEKYIIGEDGQIVIVDEFTGRQMPGRRWSDGLHQAVEAKEGVEIRGETQTLATITIQNYFRMYDKLAGMTGTAETEETEFHQIYGLDVLVIPTNRPVDPRRPQRSHLPHQAREVQRDHGRDRAPQARWSCRFSSGPPTWTSRRRCPGCSSDGGCKHQVLNAKHHKSESEIVRDAGQPGHGHDRDEHGRPRNGH